MRIKKKTNYAVIDKHFLSDKKISWKAKGIMAYMLSMPDDWTFYLDELVKHSTDGKASFRSGFDELKNAGYVHRIRKRNDVGTFDWETIVHERPHTDFPQVDNPQVEKPQVDNRTLLNNKELNNKELNNKENHSSKIRDLLSHFSPINDFVNLNKQYWDVIRETRKTGKVAESVIYNNMKKWTKYDNSIVEHALKTHINTCKGRREEYTLGIMRNTKPDEINKQKNTTRRRVARF